MKNKNILILLLTAVMISSTFLAGCKKDTDENDVDENKTTGTIYLTIKPDPSKTPCTSCSDISDPHSQLTCTNTGYYYYSFGKAQVYLSSGNDNLYEGKIDLNTKVNLGEFNEGNYKIRCSGYYYKYDNGFQTRCSGIGERYRSFQIVKGVDQNIVLEGDWN